MRPRAGSSERPCFPPRSTRPSAQSACATPRSRSPARPTAAVRSWDRCWRSPWPAASLCPCCARCPAACAPPSIACASSGSAATARPRDPPAGSLPRRRGSGIVAGLQVVDLPGHAPGQIRLWRERDRLAIVSDTIYLTDMHGRPQPPAVPLDAYNLDTESARRAVAKLAALHPATVCPGHLGPLTGDDVMPLLEAAAGDVSQRDQGVEGG